MKPTALYATTAICCLFAFEGVVEAQTQAAPEVNPNGADPKDSAALFRVGEMHEGFTWAEFYSATGDRLPERFDKFAAECSRFGAPQTVIDDIDAVRKAKLSLTFVKKPVAVWTGEELKQFTTSPDFNHDLWKKWLGQPPFERKFFVLLGKWTFEGWFCIPREVGRGVKLAACEDKVRTLAGSVKILHTSDGYAEARGKLTAEALAVIEAIAAQYELMDDPFGDGVTAKNFETIAKSCRALSDLARSNKLTVPPGSQK
jgi:hypothetical protein